MQSRMRLVSVIAQIALCGGALAQIGTVVTVAGNASISIQAALNAAGAVNAKIIIPPGSYSITSTITVTTPPSTSPSNLWIHCEPGAVLQAGATLSNGIVQLQDVSGGGQLGSIRIDGCIFDMGAAIPNNFNTPGIVVNVHSSNTGAIEIDHNMFRNSSLQGVLLQTLLTDYSSNPITSQLLSGANIHDNVCYAMVSTSTQPNPACFQSKNTIGTLYRANYMYGFPDATGTSNPVFGIMCNGDRGCSLEKNICSYDTKHGANSASCYKGLFMVGYESDGNLLYGTGDCGSTICSFAEHCDTCITSESHDNFFWDANTCLRVEVNQDDNVHDDRCYNAAEGGFIISTRESGPNDTVIVTDLANTSTGGCGTNYSMCGSLTKGAGVSMLGTVTNTLPLGTCPNTTWSSANGAGTQLTINTMSTGSAGLLISQSLGTGGPFAWNTSPVLEICISSNVSLNAGQLQFVLSDTCNGTGCATSLAQPHTTINFPAVLSTAGFIPVYGWSDSWAMNFDSTGRGVQSWGINATTFPPSAIITISVFAHDVPFMRHNIHGNHIVRPGASHGLYLQGALQNFEVSGNEITDPGFMLGTSGPTVDAIRLDNMHGSGLNAGDYPMQSGQIHDNIFTNNGGANTRRGVYYDNTGETIQRVRTFHNSYQGLSTSNQIVYANSSGTVDAYYSTGGTCTITGGSSCLVIFPAAFGANPQCTANSNIATTSGIVGVTALSATGATFTVPTTGNYTIYYECHILDRE